MTRGKQMTRAQMFVADFETCDSRLLTEDERKYNADPDNKKKIYPNQKVWLAGYKNLETMESTYFYNLDDFMKDILSRKHNVNTEIAFHNLKFDGSYIVPYLLHNSYKVTMRKPQPKEFSVLVDNRNAWYSITIQVTKKRRVTLWDSQKLFPTALEYLPQVYSTPTQKVREDSNFYEEFRPNGYIPNEREMHYFENDLQVPAEVLNKHIEIYGTGFKKTQASQSFYNFEQTFKGWKWRFPPLTDEQDELIRPAYWGGISNVAKGKECKTKEDKDYYDVMVNDINSSYPDKAANYKLPYGECVAEYGENMHPDMSKFWVAEAIVCFELKDNCLPCIPTKGILEGRPDNTDKWVDNSNGLVKLRFSSIDYQTFQLSYKFTVKRWKWSLHWAWKVQKEIAKFVYMNNDRKIKYSKLAKITEDPDKKAEYTVMRDRSKTDNNSFYGKFGEDIIKEGKTPYLEDDDIVWKVDNIQVLSEHKRKFLPVAIAITAWGRQQLVIMANILGEDFLYCDTDSIHYLARGRWKIEKAIKDGIFKEDNEELGAWKMEGRYKRGRYLRAKCYMEENEHGEIEATVAGLPADKHTGKFSKKRSCLTWDNFYIGHVVPASEANKLKTVRTPTGNKLVPTHFTINEKETLFTF